MRRLARLAIPFLAIACLALGALAVPAKADFIKNYREWQRLGPDGQAAYAMGIFDVMTVITNGDKYTAARAVGLRACAIGLNMKAALVAQAITKFYLDHPDAQAATPFIAFNGYFERGACSPFINQARKALGLPEMKAAPLPATGEQ